MKYCTYLLLALSLATFSVVHAETIDVNGGIGGYIVPTNLATKVCVKLTFIKRNAGTLITGLTTAKIKPIRVVETSIGLTGQQVSKNFNVTYTLAPSTVPVVAGVYDLCLTPSGVGNVWKKAPLPASSYFYYVDGVVLGVSALDNGVFNLLLN